MRNSIGFKVPSSSPRVTDSGAVQAVPVSDTGPAGVAGDDGSVSLPDAAAMGMDSYGEGATNALLAVLLKGLRVAKPVLTYQPLTPKSTAMKSPPAMTGKAGTPVNVATTVRAQRAVPTMQVKTKVAGALALPPISRLQLLTSWPPQRHDSANERPLGSNQLAQLLRGPPLTWGTR